MFDQTMQFITDKHNLLRLRSKKLQSVITGRLSKFPPELIKSLDEVLADMRYLITERHFPAKIKFAVNSYFVIGLHFKHKKITDYVIWTIWYYALKEMCSFAPRDTDILNHKRETTELLGKHGIRVTKSLGYLKVGAAEETLAPLFQEFEQIFCKPLHLWGGAGCMKLRRADRADGCMVGQEFKTWAELEELLRTFEEEDTYLLEECIVQHEELSAFHPSSINTLRLMTMRKDGGEPIYYQGILRMGTKGGSIDNAAAGGIYVGINDDGTLMEDAHSEFPGVPIPMLKHPDTGVVFKGIQLPYWEEARKIVCESHKAFSDKILILGWDVAMTPTGPLIIEANWNADMNIMQCAHGGWEHVYEDYLRPALNAFAAADKASRGGR